MRKGVVAITGAVALMWTGIGATAQAPSPIKFVSHLTGSQETPPRETKAVGQAIFRLNQEETAMEYVLVAFNIRNVVACLIHLGPPGRTGPGVALLYGNVAPGGGRTHGVLTRGVITSADLVGPLEGQDLRVLIAAMRSGGAYVNFLTNDGITPINTGPGDLPRGEIRGQISSLDR